MIMFLYQMLELANIASCHYFDGFYANVKRKIDVVMRLVELYRPYLFFKAMYVLNPKPQKLSRSVFFLATICYFLNQIIDLNLCHRIPYCRFDDKNTDKLRVAARNSMDSADVFHFQFDPKTIDWEDYMMNVHLPGAVKHLFK